MPKTATRSETAFAPATEIPTLPLEILVMIAKLLDETPTLIQLPFVSKQFHALVMPIIYVKVTLSAPFMLNPVKKGTKWISTPMRRQMSVYTRHLTIKREQDWTTVIVVLGSLNQLRSLTSVELPKPFSEDGNRRIPS